MLYSELQCSEAIHKAVERMGFAEMTEVQEKTIPVMLAGRDVIAKAPTGTGKTCAFGIPVAEAFGAKNRDDLHRYLANGAWLCVAVSVVFTILTTLLAAPLLQLIHTPDDIFADAVKYVRVIFLGIPATVLYNYASSVLRAMGDSQHPFYFLLALSNAMAAVLRGAGRSIVPMIVMLCCWCMFRVPYITIAVPIRPELTTISWAYPITWGLSSIIFLIYYNVVDWVHAYGRSKPRKMA